MSYYYGSITNGINKAKTLQGFRSSGLTGHIRSWEHGVKVMLYLNSQDVECVRITTTGGSHDTGGKNVLYEGPIDDLHNAKVHKMERELSAQELDEIEDNACMRSTRHKME